jgi:hypothetical protein
LKDIALPDQKLLNYDIAVSGIGCFFEHSQNTVFWDVHGETLQKLIDKPDYPTAKPHLTIYDGTERIFAHRLYKLFINFFRKGKLVSHTSLLNFYPYIPREAN